MYYDALKTFVTLVEVKNFTKTAEILLMSQPSVSLHIKKLEEEFQTKLFLRSPKFLKVTLTGEILYDRAKQMITIYEQTRQDIQEHDRSIKGELKIGASFTIGEYILPSLLIDLQEEYPELELQVVIGNTEEIVQAVRLYKVDIGLIEGQTNEKELSVHPFMQDELFIVSSNNHELANKDDVEITDLHDQAWVTREVGSGTREYLNHVIRSNGLKIKSILTISSNQGIKETLIKNGSGLALLSRSVIERDVQNKIISIIQVKDESFNRTLSYVYSPIMKDKKNVKTFITELNKKWPMKTKPIG
ncbi:LysR family transcriptional regulator [Peribacillus frigoritolerans]|jgi:DNA-binding transcriptional LysR family regulator|uniref:LysR family transcriptional regulator n=1 Tax=Peribacillus frigoritolerans TaxID=450367 RepID=UPI0007BEB958|nr:LysR family transcriptional regulator [Peribacillus frigoritolerans]MBD8137423.1 LysR family transcriptional regulator [Bacillus sp. CFBP 13597]PEO44857.1 LysR family transcriptional regulator [Bacillus sp. AFS026049]PRS42636.1 LysR family transcriptional regulator [Bacillus sp. RJGP41]MCR8869157.1 LysR family transcriptional regulator [Peribacillus frigoritolerans]MCY9004493.1 LysR family transcriptional regulator [Peribacillus frigoritolerans]